VINITDYVYWVW